MPERRAPDARPSSTPTDGLVQNAMRLLAAGDAAAAAAALREAIAAADRAEDGIASGETRVFLAEVLVEHELDLTEAKSLLESALRLATKHAADADRVGPWRLAASQLLQSLEKAGI